MTSHSLGYKTTSKIFLYLLYIIWPSLMMQCKIVFELFQNVHLQIYASQFMNHKLFHFHLSLWIWKVWKGRKKITKSWISREWNEFLVEITVFLTQIISRRQKNADAKVVLSISCRQKWNSRRQFSKNCIFLNIQLKGVVNRLPPIKNLSDHTNKFLMG